MPQSLLFRCVWILVLAVTWTADVFVGGTAQEVSSEEQERTATDQSSRPEFISPEHHAWTRFPVGAWREIKVIERTYGEDGQVAGRSEIIRTELLKEVGPHHYTYTLEQVVQIGLRGDRIQSPPINVTLGVATDEPGNVHSVAEASGEAVSFGGRDVKARVLNISTGGEAHTVLTRLWYAPEEPPYLLRTISEAVIPSTQEPVWRRTKKALAQELPYPWNDRQFSATFWEEQHVSTKGTRHSIIVTSEEIPGGVIARWTKETNLQGRLVRQEVQTLSAWGLEPDE